MSRRLRHHQRMPYICALDDNGWGRAACASRLLGELFTIVPNRVSQLVVGLFEPVPGRFRHGFAARYSSAATRIAVSCQPLGVPTVARQRNILGRGPIESRCRNASMRHKITPTPRNLGGVALPYNGSTPRSHTARRPWPSRTTSGHVRRLARFTSIRTAVFCTGQIAPRPRSSFRASKSSKAVKTASWCTRSINQPASRLRSSTSRSKNTPAYLSHRPGRTLAGR